MSRGRLTLIGLASVTVLAMLTAGLGTAAAASPEFHVEEAPALVIGKQTETLVLATSGGTVKCNSFIFEEPTFPETSSSTMDMILYPEECNVFGQLNVDPKMNGCEFTFHLVPAKGGTATVDVYCPAGKVMEFTGEQCTVKIGAQNNLGHVVFSNTTMALPPAIDVEFTLTEIEYTESKGCTGVEKTTKNATWSGRASLRSTNGGLEVQKIWIA